MNKKTHPKIRCVLVWLALAFAANTFAIDAQQPVVSRDGVTVTVHDVDAYMQKIPPDKWAGFINSAERIESMLRDLLRTKQLAKQARDLKLDQKPLARARLDLAAEDALAKLRFDEFVNSIKVPDLNQLAQEEYRAHKDQYMIPANVTVRHILIDTKDRSDADARKLAETVRAEAVANPADFVALVEKYSDDDSKAMNKGEIKDATSSKYAKEFSAAAGKLDKDHPISPVVKTRFGYHILQLVDMVPARQQTFDEVQSRILDGLRKQYIEDQKRDFFGSLTAEKMTPYPDAIAALHARYFTTGGVPVENPQAPAATSDEKAATPAQ
jgi:peptidyl-prolyl cis-trans isomerase C